MCWTCDRHPESCLAVGCLMGSRCTSFGSVDPCTTHELSIVRPHTAYKLGLVRSKTRSGCQLKPDHNRIVVFLFLRLLRTPENSRLLHITGVHRTLEVIKIYLAMVYCQFHTLRNYRLGRLLAKYGELRFCSLSWGRGERADVGTK